MNIDVIVSAAEVNGEVIKEKNVVVIDVLRATSVIVTALVNKAKYVIPVEGIEEAWRIYHQEGKIEMVLGGERNAIPIEGFHFGNSPLLYTEVNVAQKKVILTTSNGTRAIKASVKGDKIYIGSFLNASAVAKQLIKEGKDTVIVCSGTDNKYSMDDALCAGMLISIISEKQDITTTDLGLTTKILYESNKDDLHKVLSNSRHYKWLKKIGFEEDLKYCLQRDIYDIVPVYIDDKILI
ncbi:hypothetical protein BHF71_02490 [Vulcanibacillus modesticaldus]|uniref:Probable 2-phosphosulfolactate phosphatase n=1 Tax=Vulcanibacillus modesticaldus TaxID=337097 RepID=A0A1D2YTN7_9BACI|nr:2-phosphosulfolactate phosphatase [Vulcanibacillus modesticaldus]OEF99070.1 hypothetical protein BHF71_02490 [Vulcanibacillus modesticaldus]